MSGSIAGVLLAAGQSRRFGTNKLLHQLEDGTPMVVACARRLFKVLPRSLGVVADGNSEVARLLAAEGMEVIVNPNAASGMGSSIACAVNASADAAGWLIALGDMPSVPEPVIAAVADGLARGAPLVAPVYRGRRGHPVGFSARFAGALRALSGDKGARDVLLENSAGLLLLETDSEGVLLDRDTPAAFIR